MENLPKKIAFVEDRPEMLDFLSYTFSNTEGFEVCGKYRNAEEAISFLPRSEAQVVIVDIGLPGQSGIECVRKIKGVRPEIQFLMYTVFDQENNIFESLKAGANGYLLKSSVGEEVVGAVRELLQGGAPMTPAIARRITEFFLNGPQPVQEMELLTTQEKEVLKLLAKGKRYKIIADNLGITEGTVKQHIHNIYQKLHVTNRTEAINIYLGRRD
jgi:DNA-binding NarL/FixJ family response regulator